MADDDKDGGEPTLEQISARQDSLESKLDKLLEMVGSRSPQHAAAEQHTERHLDRPSSVEEQVAAELARAKAEEKAAADKEAEKSERATLAERLAKLEEKAPAPPQPRRERAMWGRRS